MVPVISVIMPVRNGTQWLREAVESVLSQEFRQFELLIIDDGSDDDAVGLLAELASTDSRVSVLRQPPKGIVAALNLGIAAAHAPYLARLDADDRARPDRLARQIAFMQTHDEVGLLGSGAQAIDGAGAVIGGITPPAEPARLVHWLRRGNPFIHSSVMLRTTVVRELGGYRAAFAGAEDYDLWLRMAEVGGIANLPEPLIAYRRHRSNVSQRDPIRQSFSVRLAQRSAALRRAGARDPAGTLSAPPDWWAKEATGMFYAPDVGFYRFLDPDGTAARDYLWAVQGRLFSLNHVERKLAQARLQAMLREAGPCFTPQHLRLCVLMGLLHPARALGMACRAISAR
jgi:glycosyltransferase involved in cell wall biosynthesis